MDGVDGVGQRGGGQGGPLGRVGGRRVQGDAGTVEEGGRGDEGLDGEPDGRAVEERRRGEVSCGVALPLVPLVLFDAGA